MRADSPQTWRVIEECAEYLGRADAELLSMYVNHCLEVELEDGLPVSTYPEYICQSILNYEQIWRESARDRDRESCELMLTHLRPEGRKFPQPEEGDEVLPPMRPQAYDPKDPVDGEMVHVTVDLWVFGTDDPDGWIKQNMNFLMKEGSRCTSGTCSETIPSESKRVQPAPVLRDSPPATDETGEGGQMKMRQMNQSDDPSDSEGNCDQCGRLILRFRGQGDLRCDCGAIYNCFGQRLRDDLYTRPNRSEWDEDCGDMEGYEEAMCAADAE